MSFFRLFLGYALFYFPYTTTIPAGWEQSMRWLLVIFIALIVLGNGLPWLEKLGIGRLPGDVRFKLFGWVVHLPFASTVLLTAIIFVVAKILR